jgi:hypothetical protein
MPGDRNMRTLLINQSASEPRLHRVLYLMKYLRAMVLHFFLGFVALMFFIGAGIEGVYPLADSLVATLKAQMDQLWGQHDVLGASFFPLIGSFTGLALLAALFVWIYLSITKVRQFTLKLQAAFFLLSALIGPLWIWPQLTFSLENLNPLFSLLVMLSVALEFVVPIDISIALWNVSRSPETSSFIAALDPRLAPGWWTYLNKLLDLPRTPIRNWRTAAAYGLSVVAAILLVASIMYLISVGSVHSRLIQFSLECEPTLAACAAQSLVLSQHILVLLGLSLVGVQAGALLQSVAKRLGGLSISDVVRNPNDRFVLYLRPFDTDDVILPKPRLPFWSRLLSLRPFPARIEEEFFDVTDGYRPLIAIGSPSKSGEEMGGMAYRAYIDNAHWQEYVLDKIQRAENIVIVFRDTEGVRWELAQIISLDAAQKTLFLFDPSAKDRDAWQALAALVLPPFQAVGLVARDFAFQGRPIGFYFHTGQLVEIENVHWTTTSYRTAFSHFLARDAG